ncbi:MAG: hypothetical protein N4J56_005584 [Chroococcidiopsis sp. SAG 2025]|nr:hypothetical protein [Chroococcidiopsis sp. SAG 2025]
MLKNSLVSLLFVIRHLSFIGVGSPGSLDLCKDFGKLALIAIELVFSVETLHVTSLQDIDRSILVEPNHP